MVRFPFKAPSEKMPLFSLDRFFLPQGLPLFVNLILIMMVVGVLLAQVHSVTYYAMLLAGLAMAIVAERFAFANAELKSEVLTGIIVLAAAVLMEFTHQARALDYMQPAMIGFASGIIGSRFLLFYLKLSKHCQRGTTRVLSSWHGRRHQSGLPPEVWFPLFRQQPCALCVLGTAGHQLRALQFLRTPLVHETSQQITPRTTHIFR
mgnify:CR=1 FL=1